MTPQLDKALRDEQKEWLSNVRDCIDRNLNAGQSWFSSGDKELFTRDVWDSWSDDRKTEEVANILWPDGNIGPPREMIIGYAYPTPTERLQ